MAQPPHHSSQDALTGLPKEPLRSPPTPPPAYYPSSLHHRQQQMIRRVMSNPPHPISQAEFTRLRQQYATGMYRVQGEEDEDTDDQEDDGRSPINLRISTTLHVEGNNNAVLLTATPADHAKAVTHAVISAIRQCSDMNGGIPMIDEEGRPRPFNITVEAGMNVEGSGNILGNEEHVMQFLGRGGDGNGGKRKRDDSDDGERSDGHRQWRRTRRSSL
ncbi:hypothetical protein VP1G_09887 [Cytospora mali]|nr:hypothetical protein VP1G_09887 [Valsa mali var. pyri (nom. inval.)]